jgi:putative membrane protein
MQIIRSSALLLAFAGLPILLAAQAQPNGQGTTIPGAASQKGYDTIPNKGPGESALNFLKDAAVGNMAEVQLGQLAEAKAQSPQVKQFAEKMVSDHSKAQDQLKSIAQTQQVGLPIELDRKHQDLKANLDKLSGAQFDRAYMLAMVQDHQKTVSEFQQMATYGNDPEVKQLAAGSLPMLKDHLQLAEQTLNAIKSGATQ